MNSDNSNNPSLQAILLTMMLEKIDSLTNRIGDMQVASNGLKQSVDSLTARIGALESSVAEAKKETTEAKLNDIIADDKREEDAVEEEPPKEAQTSSAVVEVKKEPETKSQGFGDRFNKKEGEWDCQTCYLRNKPSENACVSCGTGKDGKEVVAAAPTFKPPTTFSSPANAKFSFGINKPATPSFGFTPSTTTTTTPAAPSPAKTEASTTETTPAATKSLFGTPQPITFSFGPPQQAGATTNPFANASAFGAKSTTDGTQPKSLFGGPTTSSANKIPLSFSSFASGTSFLDKKPTNSINHSFGAQKSSTFSKSEEPKKDNGEESENPEEYVPDAHYEPVIPLPDKVEVVTGEESEQVLFKNRAKLYIFNSDTKEVKERGIGDIKVLFHPEKNTYRVVMRREQVHKICANFRITDGMSITDKPGLKNCGVFSCVDFSENVQTGSPTVFYVRFREEDAYEKFKKLITDIATTNDKSKMTATKDDIPQSASTDDYYDCSQEEDEENVVLEVDCNVTMDLANKPPLAGNRYVETFENATLIVLAADDGIYQVQFDSQHGEFIFPHYLKADTKYNKNGKKITFIGGNEQGVQKYITCEFANAAAADEAYEILLQCRNDSRFIGYDD